MNSIEGPVSFGRKLQLPSKIEQTTIRRTLTPRGQLVAELPTFEWILLSARESGETGAVPFDLRSGNRRHIAEPRTPGSPAREPQKIRDLSCPPAKRCLI